MSETNPELKAALEKTQQMFNEFKSANDQMQAEVKKMGSVDTVLSEKVERLNSAITASEEKAQKLFDDLKAEQQRILAFGNPAAAKSEYTPDQQAHHKAFMPFLRKGVDAGLADLQQKAMSVGSDVDGGYTVPLQFDNRVITRLRDLSDMRSLATVITVSGDALEVLNDTGDVSSGWVNETASRADTNTPQLGKSRIPVQEMYAQPVVTQKLLDDSMWDIEAYLANKVANKFARDEGAAFVTGDGVAKPRGFASYATAATADSSRAWGTLEHVATGTSGGFGSNGTDKIIDLVHRFKPAYLSGAKWTMSRATLSLVRQLKDSTGNYLYIPSPVAGVLPTLLGYDVQTMEDMPAVAANALAIAFGNFAEGYTIVDRMGTRLLRDPYTNKPNVKFYFTKRVGGDVVDFDAIKFIKFA